MDIDKNIAGPLISNGPVLKLINFSNFNVSSNIFLLKEKISDCNKSNGTVLKLINFSNFNVSSNIFILKEKISDNSTSNNGDKINSIAFIASNIIHNIGKKINQINIFNLNFYISKTIGVKINFISKGMLIKKFDEIKSEETNDLKNYIFRDNRYKLIIKHRKINKIIYPKTHITYYNKPTKRI